MATQAPLDPQIARHAPEFLATLAKQGPWATVGALSWAQAKGLSPSESRRLLYALCASGHIDKQEKGESVTYRASGKAWGQGIEIVEAPPPPPAEEEEADEVEPEQEELVEQHLTESPRAAGPLPPGFVEFLLLFATFPKARQDELLRDTKRVLRARQELVLAERSLTLGSAPEVPVAPVATVAARPTAPGLAPNARPDGPSAKILALLSDANGWHVQDVAKNTGIPVSVVSATLVRLTNRNVVKRESEGKYRMAAGGSL